jgi:hypothetical protein
MDQAKLRAKFNKKGTDIIVGGNWRRVPQKIAFDESARLACFENWK